MTTQTLTISRAAIRTDKARNYLIQLCKHFGHKIEATYADNRGRIVFPSGVCSLDADDAGALIAQVTTQEEAQLVALEDVIERHLKRFAFKEELSVQWVREA